MKSREIQKRFAVASAAVIGAVGLTGCDDLLYGGEVISASEGQAKVDDTLQSAAAEIGSRALRLARTTGKGGIGPAILNEKDTQVTFFVDIPYSHEHYSLMIDMKNIKGKPEPSTTYDVDIGDRNDRNASKTDFDYDSSYYLSHRGNSAWFGLGSDWFRDPGEKPKEFSSSTRMYEDFYPYPSDAVDNAEFIAEQALKQMDELEKVVRDPVAKVNSYRE